MEQITKHISQTNLTYAGAAVAVAGAAVAAGAWIASSRVPHGPVEETYTFQDEEKDHGGLLVAKVLQHHNVKYEPKISTFFSFFWVCVSGFLWWHET